jgi:DNA-binding PadR family transcriptional regulator
MYELFILGQLLANPKSGYQIRARLQNTLGLHRQISYGVLYPLLDKMQRADYIGIKEQGIHSKKVYEILPVGRKQFQQLMEQPIPENAHTEDLFMIKLDVMQYVSPSRQLALLDEYQAEQHQIVNDINIKMHALLNDSHRGHRYAYKLLELRLARANTTLKWIQVYQEDINGNVQPE